MTVCMRVEWRLLLVLVALLSRLRSAHPDLQRAHTVGAPSFNCSVPDQPSDREPERDSSGFRLSRLFRNLPSEWPAATYNPSTWTLGLTRVKVIELCFPSGDGGCPSFDYDTFFREQSEFYLRSSGGQQRMEFTLERWSDTPFYTEQSCSRDSSKCFGGSIFDNTIGNYEKERDLSGFDRYMFVLKNRCRCLMWSGLGQITGPVTWINGVPTLRTVTHELGHNNGALHANVHQKEYANDLSVMGASTLVSDFTAIGKGE